MSNPTCTTMYSSPLPIPNFNALTPIGMYECAGIDPVSKTPINLQRIQRAWNGESGIEDEKSCFDWYDEFIYQGMGIRKFDEARYKQVQNQVAYLLSRYYSTLNENDDVSGHFPVVPGQFGYNQFQETLLQLCSAEKNSFLPGLCDIGLQSICNGCSTKRGLFSSYGYSTVRRFCGCYILQDPNYKNVSPECDPACAPASVSKKPLITTTGNYIDLITNWSKVITGKTDPDIEEWISQSEPTDKIVITKVCTSAVCVIDDITISTNYGSQIGNINFTQVCPQCEDSKGCRCIIDTSIDLINEKLGIPDYATFTQYCGKSGSQCIKIDPTTGVLTEVDCANDFTTLLQTYPVKIPKILWIFIALIVVIFIIVLWFVYLSRNNDSKNPIDGK